jgi:hypothetical protein
VKEDDSGLLLALRTERAKVGGHADHPHPPFSEIKNRLRPLPEMPRIFSLREVSIGI